jgi:hypothetical protein
MKLVTYGVGGYDPTKPNNNVLEEIELTDWSPDPLNSTGALATLLAVTEVITVEDAANAVSLTPADLVAEAEAWAAAMMNNI